jgi:hypothetical protein
MKKFEKKTKKTKKRFENNQKRKLRMLHSHIKAYMNAEMVKSTQSLNK